MAIDLLPRGGYNEKKVTQGETGVKRILFVCHGRIYRA